MRRNTKSLKRNDKEREGILIATYFTEIPYKIAQAIVDSLLNVLSKACTAFAECNATFDFNDANIFDKTLLEPCHIVSNSRRHCGAAVASSTACLCRECIIGKS